MATMRPSASSKLGWTGLLSLVVGPPLRIRDTAQAAASRSAAIVGVFLAVAVPISEAILTQRRPEHRFNWPAVAIVVFLYALARSGRPKAGVSLAVTCFPVVVFLRVWLGFTGIRMEGPYALAANLLLAWSFLSIRALALVAVGQMGLLAVLAVVSPDVASSGRLEGPVVASAITALPLLFFARLRERAEADRRLDARMSEDRLRFALGGAHTGTWEWDLTSGRIQWSDEVAPLFGLATGAFDGRLETYLTLIHPDDRERIHRTVLEAVASPREFTIEHRVRTDGGQVRWLEGRGRAFCDDSGRALRVSGAVADITQRKETEEALRREVAFRKAVIDRAAEGLCVCHAIDEFPFVRFTVYNPRMEAITGYSMEEINRQGWYQTLYPNPAVRARAIDRMARMRYGDDILAEEWEVARKDGESRIVSISTSVLLASEGPPHVLALMQDLTERRRSESERTRLATILESTSDLVSIARPDGSLTYLNRAGRRMLGWGEDEPLVGHTIGDVHRGWARTIVETEGIPAAVESGLWQGETALLGRDGRETPVSQVIMSHRSADGRLEYLSTIMRDVSEAKRSAQVLQESEERFRLLAEVSSEGVGITEAGRLVDANQQLSTILGYDHAEILGREVLDFVAPESRALVSGNIGSGGVGPYEHQALRKDGTLIPVEIRAATIPFGGGQRRVTTIQDLTERTKVEAERIALERQVQHTQRLESLGVLAGGIAHDFNNLLVGILGNLDLAMRELLDQTAAHEAVAAAVTAARRAAELTRQLLAYSGRGKFVVEPVDLNALVGEMGELLRAAIRRSVRFETCFRTDLPPIEGDPAQIRQVVMNLIVNAAEAIGEGGGTITLTTGARHIAPIDLLPWRVPLPAEPGHYAFVEVRDDGCGMDESIVDRMFEPFFTTKFSGRGLGMAAVLGILRGHGGSILVESTPGRGSTITATFPEAVPREVEAEAERPWGPSIPRALTRGPILVVEDEPLVRDVCCRMLRALGYQVIEADSGRDATSLFSPGAPEFGAVILDLTMPDMDGATTAVHLLELQPNIPIIIASGYSEVEILQRLEGVRVAAFLEKPFRLEVLRETVGRFVSPAGS